MENPHPCDFRGFSRIPKKIQRDVGNFITNLHRFSSMNMNGLSASSDFSNMLNLRLPKAVVTMVFTGKTIIFQRIFDNKSRSTIL